MKTAPGLPLVAMTVAAAALLALVLAASPASADIMFGTLSNFDVFNDTGEETHGFEIELDDISSANVVYTFGGAYSRYGNPIVTDFPGGVYVRYESPYAPGTGFTQATPLAPNPVTPTAGHSCYNGGPIGNYATSGCEHFGVSVSGSPTKTVYRWLIADPANPGALQPAGTKVSIPAPVWNVVPPAVPGNPPVVQAVIQAEPVPPAFEFGEAQWVKVFVTETPNQAELDHLVTDDPAVPQEPIEVEIEWVLLQADAGKAGKNNELAQEAPLGGGHESITRRYEFYKYAGAYDPETNEALCDDPTSGLPECGVPDADGIAGVGEYIGAQMAALNLNPPVVPTVSLSVTATGAGSGTVTSAPPAIDCGVTCTAPVDAGAPVTLTAAPAAGSFFAGWGGDCAGTELTTLITPSVDASCTAAFELLAASADLSASAKQSPAKKPQAGHRVTYHIKVKNLGPAPAAGAVLTVDISGLPASDLASIHAPKGCAVLGGSVTCPLGDLKAGRTAARSISVIPSLPGTIDMTADATSGTPDPEGANDVAAIATVVQ